jgi:acyl carrier protein
MIENQPRVDTLRLLQAEVSKILSLDSDDIADSALGELGLDSLNVVELMLTCEQLYGAIDLDSVKLDYKTTLRQLDRQLSDRSSQRALDSVQV